MTPKSATTFIYPDSSSKFAFGKYLAIRKLNSHCDIRIIMPKKMNYILYIFIIVQVAGDEITIFSDLNYI